MPLPDLSRLAAALVLLVLAGAPAAADLPPAARAALERLGFTQLEALAPGTVIGTDDLPERHDRELATGIATILTQPLAAVLEQVRAQEGAERATSRIDAGWLDPAAPDLSALGLPADEAARWGRGDPAVNLSAGEHAATADLPGTRAARQVLAARLAAYAQDGLPAVDDYLREDGTVSAGADLDPTGTPEQALLAEHLPDLAAAWAGAPGLAPATVAQRFSWVLARVEERAHLVLVHDMTWTDAQAAVFLKRQFYSSHTYNGLETRIGLLTVPEGTLLIMTNRTSTDRVAGFPQGVRHAVGRQRVQDRLRRNLERLQAALAG